MKDYEISIGKEKKKHNKFVDFLKEVSPWALVMGISFQIKRRFINRLFWGRGFFYKKFLHISFVVLTSAAILTGVTNKFYLSEETNVLAAELSNPGDIDLLEQGSDIQMVLLAQNTYNFNIKDYVVQEGDTLQSISDKFAITAESVKSSNLDTIPFYDETVTPGDTLLIPEINGVLISVKAGDTLQTVMSKITEGNKLDIIEINNLDGEEHVFKEDRLVLVPDGRIVAPAKPIPDQIWWEPNYSNVIISQNVDVSALNGFVFIDPLSHPSCVGYSYSRGFSSWHNGVDLAKWGGCEVRAIAAGTVIYSGWEPQGGGYAITIDHGNGVHSIYFHADSLYVKTGDQVYQGQEISHMGCTGLCTGTHLHLGLRVNYYYIDPAPYVPYWRP